MTNLVVREKEVHGSVDTFTAHYERTLFALLFIGFCTIFFGLEVNTPIVVLKPFDIACIICTPILIFGLLVKGRACYSTGFGLFALFLVVNVLLAFQVSKINGLREAIQATELVMFSYVLILYARQIDWLTIARLFIFFAVLITIYNAYWHISNGIYFGWKRLDEPKLLFSYAVPVIFSLMLWANQRARKVDYLIVGLIAFVLIVSGERKAQLAFVCNLIMLTTAGYFRLSVLTCLALAAAPFAAVLIFSDEYLTRQFFSILDSQQFEFFTLTEIATGEVGITRSNSQRIFAGQVTGQLFWENPLLGLGTNGYITFIQEKYYWLPDYFLTGIHNEFQRILVENGLVGLTFYVLPWARSFFLGLLVYKKQGGYRATMYAMFWTTLFIQCFFEGAGNEALLAFMFASLLPEMFMSAVRQPVDQLSPRSTESAIF